MNRKASTTNPFLVGLFLLAAAVPCAFGQSAADEKKDHDMSPGVKILPGPPVEGSFIPDPVYPEAYDSQAQIDVYGAKHMNPNPTGVPPVELGIRLYDRGAYTPRPAWLLGPKDPGYFGFMTYGDLRIAGDSYDNGNGKGKQEVVAARLNLDMDLALTPTERIHLDRNAQVNPAGAAGSKNGVYGFSGFADALRGYIEFGYGYLKADNSDLSYSNVTAAFTRRYPGRLSNSIRVIDNFGQKGIPGQAKTADGLLVLVENSLTPQYLPLSLGNQSNFVPYLNVFAGFNSPQSLARGGDSGGVLRNTGITFESDGMTAYPTLDATARKSYGGALGLEYLGDLAHQIVVEGSVVERMSGNTSGSQYAIGVRYQQPISPDLIIRFDAMKGWLQGKKDIYGVRAELRLKF